ncbi:hypothetical protein F511_29050 [Dorcoceras hygrometricum]|uniref:Uncharacterized protein n=1 Tax=Dorcoceras hygrometricum TaxID=472368 RepID=A0A2Z7CB21_9LAMI|nr:hypothetical protein F511_29050 [Dorcoceras hygrometricum]
MQIDSDLVIYRTTLLRTFQVSTRSVLGKCVYLVTLAMSLFDLQDVCIAIGSIATLDLPMVVDLIGIYGLKGPYRTLITTDWFLQALSVIPRGSWGDVARRFTMIRWAGKWVYLVAHAMSLFDLQDVCMVIGSLATLDLPMVVDLIGIFELKGPYCMLTMTYWFLQTLSVTPRGTWGDAARRFTMIKWGVQNRYLAGNSCLAPTGFVKKTALHGRRRTTVQPHDPLGITDSACKNQLVVVSVQYGPFNPYNPIRSKTIGKSRVAIDPIAMHTSWRSNSDITSATRVSMTFRVVRTNQYKQDLRLIHSTNGNHLESPKEGSSIDHQVTIYLHAQNIIMFPTNETWADIGRGFLRRALLYRIEELLRSQYKIEVVEPVLVVQTDEPVAIQPKNLKISKSTKTGPISHTGPKTSRAARDRPEPKPRRNQPSRHRRSFAGAAAGRRRRHTKDRTAAARDVAPSATHGRAQHRRATSAPQVSTSSIASSDQQASSGARSSATTSHHARSGATSSAAHDAASVLLVGATSCACCSNSRPLSHGLHARRLAQQLALIGGQRTRHAQPYACGICARGGAAACGGGRWPTHENIGYPRMSASGESSTTMHRLLHASGSHPIPTPYDPKTNLYNQDIGLIHSTNGNHLESPNEGSSIDHQVTIYLHAQNITMFPTNETWYFASQILVSNSGGLILILTAQSTRNMFRIHSDY